MTAGMAVPRDVPGTADPVLEISGLATSFFTKAGEVRSVADMSLTLNRGEILGLVGESGSGKSVAGLSMLGLVAAPGRICGGSIRLEGQELVGLSEPVLRRLRGRKIAMIFQDPMMSLNPVLSIGLQLVEAVRAHRSTTRHQARDIAVRALDAVGIPSPAERLNAYPHQLSGGMKQRVVIAMALLHDPAVIVADEPTTALDVTVQAQILHLVQERVRDAGTALIWISHDLSIVAGLCDRVAVMYAGRLVETGPTDDVLRAPRHPYTRGLIDSIPGDTPAGMSLRPISGLPPSPLSLPPGCPFTPRCAHATAQCSRPPSVTVDAGGRLVRCFHPLRDA